MSGQANRTISGIEIKGPMRAISVALDQIAKKILEELAKGSLSANEIAKRCTGGAMRMASPRLVWLEGLGLIESAGGDTFGITAIGVRFLAVIA
jgi:hypothetical protein